MDVDRREVVLDGIDTQRRVCVNSVYLGRETENGDPALQHAYAATTYQAQGSTVDRAYVMADPSMDPARSFTWLLRAAGRRTWLYATPEVQVEREEFAPGSPVPFAREGLDHIAAAAERDGAQLSAHDEALRSRLGSLSSEELRGRQLEWDHEARRETARQESLKRAQESLAELTKLLNRERQSASGSKRCCTARSERRWSR